MSDELKVLVFDLETLPLEVYAWGLWDQHTSVDQIKFDSTICAWAAKWLDEPASKTMYMDNRDSKDIRDDRLLVKRLAGLINQADVVITQNGDKFDILRVNARAIINGLPPIKPVRSSDILKEGRKVFSFPSHSLAYVSDRINVKYKKLDHKEYPGFSLWKALLDGDQKAWPVMRKYNIHDVLATEETYNLMKGWIKTQNFALTEDGAKMRCRCGSQDLIARGFAYTDAGKYQIYNCKSCGKWPRGSTNLMRGKTTRETTR